MEPESEEIDYCALFQKLMDGELEGELEKTVREYFESEKNVVEAIFDVYDTSSYGNVKALLATFGAEGTSEIIKTEHGATYSMQIPFMNHLCKLFYGVNLVDGTLSMLLAITTVSEEKLERIGAKLLALNAESGESGFKFTLVGGSGLCLQCEQKYEKMKLFDIIGDVAAELMGKSQEDGIKELEMLLYSDET